MIVNVTVAQPGPARSLDLATIFSSDTFKAQLPAALKWLPGGKAFAFVEATSAGGHIMQRGVNATSAKPILRLGDIPNLPAGFTLTDFSWHPDSGFFLLQGPVTTDWQGYTSAEYHVYNSKTRQSSPLGQAGQQLQLVKLSPDGSHAGYVSDNNLYLAELESGRVTAITTDGSDAIFNGIFDYGSTEFGAVDGWRWSPDSKKIAFWRMDAGYVRYYPLIDELHSYSQVRRFRYPNTGEAHAVNRIGVYSTAAGSTAWVPVNQDPDDYLPQLHWDAAGTGLYIQHLTRDHKTLRLWYAGADTLAVKLVLTDTDPAWLDITDDLRPLRDGSLIWTSEKSGFRHIYLVRQDGSELMLTKGDWSVDAVIGVNETDGWVYFYAKKDSLIDQHVYRVRMSDKSLERLTTKPGWHSWVLDPHANHALATHSDARTPQSLTLLSAAGEPVATLVEKSVPALDEFSLAHTEFVTFTTDDGISLNAFFIKPPDFDPARQYPVIGYGYGNAGSQVVVNRWGTQRGPTQDLWHRYMAQQGYVIFAMDNRTTTGRGKAAKNLTYGEYGKYAVLDYVQAVNYLKTQPWIDSERIGFWGWSGGGYLAAALMTKAAPLFKVGVSVAPVIDLTRYQAVGVERWMGKPEENPKGYAAVNLMNYADRLQGKLLLLHGTGDENVKFAFTLQFADSLIRADKQFDMMVYPNQRHGISDYRHHVFSTITRYFNENL